MPKCPTCSTPTSAKFLNTPYWMCPNCDLWFQDPLPPKVFEADHEKDENGGFRGHLMSDYEKGVNKALAENIFFNHMGGKTGKMLDVGSKYPYLSHCFKNLGCEAFGMDNIEIVPEYSKELEVPMLMADFEKLSNEQIQEWTHTEKFQVITMVHMFEHLYDPLKALRRVKELLTEDGILFLRLPDHGVEGYERDLTPGHYTIHPFFHSLTSLLEILVQGKDLFTISWTSGFSGQRDLVLRPIKKEPSIWCGMIVKNEERDLPHCLKSIEDVVDGVEIIDTGSTDNTQSVAIRSWKKDMGYRIYTGASELDSEGDWKLWDFSKARNEFVDAIDAKPSADYLIWMDADDVLKTPEIIKRAKYLNEYDVFGLMMNSGDLKWVHHRMWKTRLGIKFEGSIHEYPTHGAFKNTTLMDAVIYHDAAPGVGEGSNARNLRILEKEMTNNPNPRCAFYLANTHKDAGRWEEGIKFYDVRIKMGEGYRDEWLFAYLYKARCERAANKNRDCERTLLEALSNDPDWAEFWMELAYLEFSLGAWRKSLGYSLEAMSRIPSETQLWREINKYTDQPKRMASFCCEFLGKKAQALYWAEEAKKDIGAPDKEWEDRIKELSKGVLKRETSEEKRIALHRPGATGDIIMTLNLLPGLRKKYPNHKIDYFCNTTVGEGLAPLFRIAGVDRVIDYQLLNQKIADYDKIFNLVGYPLHEGYPEKPMKNHLLHYFMREVGLSHGASLPQLSVDTFPSNMLPEMPYCTIHVQAGWSHYKNWAFGRWEKVIEQCPEISFIQLGSATDYKLKGAYHGRMGQNLMESVDLIANAAMHVGVDSFTNHLTHIRWNGRQTPAIILWGSTQASAAGYPENINISLGLECQPCFRENPAISASPRGVCINPPGQEDYNRPRHACMAGISVERVTEEVKRLWSAITKS